ncbi:MAG: LysR family transcriptional regulator [Betaproteobacteria bacterium]
MDLRSLRHFLVVADELSFSLAAKRLSRSQPGLSRSIKELESEFGIELFERVGRRIQLKPEGTHLLAQVRALVSDADRLLQNARQLARGQTFTLRVGGASNTLERVMPDVLRLYRKQWSSVEVLLHSEGGTGLLTALERGELDIAIVRTTHSDLLQSKVVFPTHLVAVVGRKHRLARRRAVTVEDLEGERLLVPPSSFTSRMILDSVLNLHRVRLSIALESHDLNTLVALAEAEYGVAIAPSTINLDTRSVAAMAILENGHPLGSTTSLVWLRRRKLPPHASAFIKIASRHLSRNYPGKSLRLPPLRQIR